MPCRYVIHTQYGLILSTAWDRVSFAEVTAHQERLLHDPEYDPDFKQLIDATTVTNLDVSFDQIRDFLARRQSRAQWAFLAHDLVILSLGRVLEARSAVVAGADSVKVFSDRKEALRWLGLEHLPSQLL